MSVACGSGFTYVVTEKGAAWSTGHSNNGQLGLGYCADVVQLQKFKSSSNDPVVMVAAGREHGVLVTKSGRVWSWGFGGFGQLGHGDTTTLPSPSLIGMFLSQGTPVLRAVMVACGRTHTLVLTHKQNVYSFGDGLFGKLGHGSVDGTAEPTLVLCSAVHAGAQTPLSNILMVSAGAEHNVALGAEGLVWTWGCGIDWQLGHRTTTDRLVAGLVDSAPWESAGGEGGSMRAARDCVVVVAAGGAHTAAVMSSGALYVWGSNHAFQLGVVTPDPSGDRCMPQRVVTGWRESAETGLFSEKHVLTVACGYTHTMAVMKDGSLFTWGAFATPPLFSGLGHISNENAKTYGDCKLCPAQVNPEHFDGKVVSAAAGMMHSAVVTDKGTLYTWGKMHGIAHAVDKCFPTAVITPLMRFMGEEQRIGSCHTLSASKALAFAMGTHTRLGGGSAVGLLLVPLTRMSLRQQGKAPAANTDQPCHYYTMPADLVQRVVRTCVSWPAGLAGETEGIVRLLGGGMIMP